MKKAVLTKRLQSAFFKAFTLNMQSEYIATQRTAQSENGHLTLNAETFRKEFEPETFFADDDAQSKADIVNNNNETRLPTNFELRTDGNEETENGVYFVDGENETKICSPLKILSATRDRDGASWGRMLELTDIEALKVGELEQRLEAVETALSLRKENKK